jgi:hypothetical protein
MFSLLWVATISGGHVGVFSEAAAFGAALVVPKDTWMADRIAAGEATGITFEAARIEEITAALEAVLNRRAEFLAAARTKALRFRAQHSAEATLAEMLALASAKHEMHVGYAYGDGADFTRPLGSRHYLLRGWSHTEDGAGVWTDGDEAELSFILPSPPSGPLHVRATLVPFLDSRRRLLRVDVSAGRVAVAEWTFKKGEAAILVREGIVPVGGIAGRELRLVFHIRDAVSPKSLGLSSDPRRLGVMLRTLVIVPADQSEVPAPALHATRSVGV